MDTSTLEQLKAAVKAEEARLAFERRMLAFGYTKGKLGRNTYWFNNQGVPVFDEAGNAVGSYGTAHGNPAPKKVEDKDEAVCFAEAIFDIACNAQKFVDLGSIDPEDSRELFQNVYFWAKEFEEAHRAENEEFWANGDYIVAIDTFARDKLFEQYAAAREKGVK